MNDRARHTRVATALLLALMPLACTTIARADDESVDAVPSQAPADEEGAPEEEGPDSGPQDEVAPEKGDDGQPGPGAEAPQPANEGESDPADETQAAQSSSQPVSEPASGLADAQKDPAPGATDAGAPGDEAALPPAGSDPGSPEDAQVPTPGDAPEPGEAEFQQGVELARQQKWEAAVEAFDASLAAADRPATRYNLARAHAALDQHVEAARHALAFLALPRSPHRGEARAELESLLAETLASLAVLELTVTPEDARVRVDGAPLDVTDHAGRAYLRPGTHRIEVRAPGHLPFEAKRLLPSGQVTTVAVALASEPVEAEPIVTTVPVRWQRPLALSLAATGSALWGAALGTYAAAQAKRDEVAATDPQARGSLNVANPYVRLRDATAPLAFAGGALAAAAGLVAERAPARVWSWAPLTAGTGLAAAGLALAIPNPDRVGAWNTVGPRRALGYVLLGASLPALGLGARWLWPRADAEVAVGPTGLRGRF